MSYYRRRYRNPSNRPPGPIEVDIDSLLSAIQSAPTYRARTASVIQVAHKDRRDSYRYSWQRNTITMYDGRKKVEAISEGRVVLIQPEKWGWRISTSATAEATHYLIKAGPAPTGADRISESAGLTIYQTPASLLSAALYQHENKRRALALAFMDQAITLKAKHSTEQQIDRIDKSYNRFAGLCATALSNPEDERVPDNFRENVRHEADNALVFAIRIGTSLIKKEWTT